MAYSGDEQIDETQMMEEDGPALKVQRTARFERSQTPYEAKNIVDKYKNVAERINETYKQLDNQREAIKRERQTTECLIRAREEICSRLEEAKKATLHQEKCFQDAEKEFLRAKEAMIESHRKKLQNSLDVELISTQLKDVDTQISASSDRVAKQMEEMRRICNENTI